MHDDRVIRLLDGLLYTGGLLGDWTTRQLHTHILARHRLREEDYTLGQLRYDLGKLRAHGLVERVGRSRRYRLTPDGVRLGALLVKIRTRLLGPLFADSTLARSHATQRQPQHRGGRTAHRRPSPRHPLRHPRAYDGCCLTARPPPPSSCRAPHRQPAQFAQNRQFGRTRRLESYVLGSAIRATGTQAGPSAVSRGGAVN